MVQTICNNLSGVEDREKYRVEMPGSHVLIQAIIGLSNRVTARHLSGI